MSSNIDLVNYWLNLSPFSEQEALYITSSCPDGQYLPVYEDEHLALQDSYFSLLSFSKVSSNTHEIKLFDCATDCIKSLFENFCKDDVLVVTSDSEHDNVKKLVSKQKHTYILKFFDEILAQDFNKFEEVVKSYKKVFFYCIGTQISNGIITSQSSLEKIKQILIKYNIEHTFVLDDVHGMFIVPRDYSIFDYIIYTCHALVVEFNLGMCIKKKESLDIGGFRDYMKSIAYKKALDVILSRKDKFYQFKYVMYQYFEDLFREGILELPKVLTAPHIFAPEVHISKGLDENTRLDMKKQGVRFEATFNEQGVCDSKIYLRIREAQYFTNPELLMPGLELTHEILEYLK